MTAIQKQLKKMDEFDVVMSKNIFRLSEVSNRMRDNVQRCRLISVQIWREKAEKILSGGGNGNGK